MDKAENSPSGNQTPGHVKWKDTIGKVIAENKKKYVKTLIS